MRRQIGIPCRYLTDEISPLIEKSTVLIVHIDLAKVDVWLAAHNGWLLFIGDILFRLVCGLVLLLCGLCIASLTKGLRFAPPPLPQPLPLAEKAGRRRMPTTPAKIPKRNVAGKVLGILVCLIIGYFAFIGVIWIG